MPYVFNPSVFVQAGYETASGDWNSQDKAYIQQLRRLHPELSCWGDLAIGFAWGDYSQDILAVSWVDWIGERDSGFLAYIFVKSKNPGFKFGGTGLFDKEIFELGEEEPWLTDAELPPLFSR